MKDGIQERTVKRVRAGSSMIPYPEQKNVSNSRMWAGRALKGLSRKELGDAVGVTTATIKSWENGRTAPSSEQIDALVAATGANRAFVFLNDFDGGIESCSMPGWVPDPWND